jgi:hypothetical protein
MSELANFWTSVSNGPNYKAPRVPLSHQLEAFECEHGLFDHAIFGLVRLRLFFNVGNTIRFVRAVNC